MAAFRAVMGMNVLKWRLLRGENPSPDPRRLEAHRAVRRGDYVLSLHEDDPHSVPYPRRVVSLFVSTSTLLEIGIGGRAIRTTAEHPFWVKDRGWIAAQHIQAGDELWTRDGRWLAVDSLQVLIGSATVYNVEIEEYHTYFVGDGTWGFAVWAHNQPKDCGTGQGKNDQSAPNSKAALYEVDTAYKLRKNPTHGVPTDTIAEHTPQTKWSRDLIPGHSDVNAVGREPAIRVSTKEAEAITQAETLTRVPASAREALATKIRILRNHTDAPNSSLQQLIEMSKKLHPWDYLRL